MTSQLRVRQVILDPILDGETLQQRGRSSSFRRASKVGALKKRLAGLLVEGQDLKTGFVQTLAMTWLRPTKTNLTILWNLRECVYRYYTDEELRRCGMEINETDPAKLKKRLRANLEKLLPEIDQAEKEVKSHPYYRNARRPKWRSCFCLLDVEEPFKRYGLPVEYIEYDIANKPIREQRRAS